MAYKIHFIKENSQDLEMIQFVVNELNIVLKDPNGLFRGILEWTYYSAKRKQSEIQIIKLRLVNKKMSCRHYWCTNGSCTPSCDMTLSSNLDDKDRAYFNDIVNDILDKKTIAANVVGDRARAVRKGLVRC